jgi:RNA polymerase sigma factor (sigma-70 family)
MGQAVGESILMADKEAHEVLTDDQFREHLTEVLPQLRAFSRSLTGSQPEFADDLVQDALLRAWSARASFRAGTNFRAWIFVILRNLFLSEMRRSKFKGEWNEIAAEKLLVSPVHQERHIELADMQRALSKLPVGQRESLILVGAGGFSYKDAAEITGVAVGTVKSRVARARTALEEIMAGDDPLPDAKEGESQPFEELMERLDTIADGRGDA